MSQLPRSRQNRTEVENAASRLQFEHVEPRVLFSATAVDTGETEVHHELPQMQEEVSLESFQFAETAGDQFPEEEIVQGLNHRAADLEDTERRELVFVSSGLFDETYLAQHLDPAYEMHVIEPGSDGIRQIAAVLEGRTGIDALHILTHGEDGRLSIGGTTLDASSMEGEHGEMLRQIGAALSGDSDILIYGCDFTEGDEGVAAAAMLAELTGADVAASNDKTGHADLGGDWVLETAIGEIEASSLALTGWEGLLAAPSVSMPSVDLSTLEDQAIVFNGANLISVNSDTFTELTVTLSVGQGSLTLSGTAGITFLNGTLNGSSSLEFSGTITDLNNALNGLVFTPAQDTHGNETITISAEDEESASSSASKTVSVISQNDAPVLVVNHINAAATGTPSETASHTFNLSNILAVDPDNSNNQLTYIIESLPTNGSLRLNGFPVVIGSVFTQTALSSGALVYIHNGGENHTDSFILTVNDGAGGSDAMVNIPITITPVNDAMSVSTQAVVYEGGSTRDGAVGPGKPVPALSLSISDAESDLKTVTITSLPGGGVLSYNGTTITQTMVNNGFSFSAANFSLLEYLHNGVDDLDTRPSNRSFNISVVDQGGGAGAGAIRTVNHTVNITVVGVNDELNLVHLSAAIPTIASGDSYVLSLADLEVNDPDGPEGRITYTLVSSPLHGEFYIAGQRSGTGASFTQAQLEAGQVEFSNGGVNAIDSLFFTVTDSEISILTDELGTLRTGDHTTPARILELRFQLTAGMGGGGTIIRLNEGQSIAVPDIAPGDVIELTTAPVEGTIMINGSPLSLGATYTVQPGDSVIYQHGGDHIDNDAFVLEVNSVVEAISVDVALTNDAPVLTVAPLTGGYEGFTKAITTSNLQVTDEETTDPARLIYTVTGSPAGGTLLRNGVAIPTFGTFSHQDVIDGLISYQHAGSERFLDSISLTVSDGSATDSGVLPIEIIAVNDQPSVTANFLELLEGELKAFTAANLGVSDADGVGADIPLAQDSPVQIQIDSLPTHGSLYYNDPSTGMTLVAPGFIFNHSQIGRFHYQHDGSENFSDSFNFTVLDNNVYANPGFDAPGNRSGTMNLGMIPVNDAPTVTVNSGLVSDIDGDRRVYEGGTRVLTTAVLDSFDPDSTDEQVQYRITAAPVNGTLLLNGVRVAPGTAFTQADLASGKLSYRHNGSETTTDEFRFRIDDGSSNVPEATFQIGIVAVNDAPTISAPSNATINTADYHFTGARTISIADNDASTGNITVTLTASDAVGLLRVTSTTGLTSVTGNDTDNELVLVGSRADINAALATLRYRASDLDTSATLTIQVSDGGNLGVDPSQVPSGEVPGLVNTGTNFDELASRVVNLLVSPIDDAPEITVPGAQTAYEDVLFTFNSTNGNAISISDVDAFGGNLEVTLSVLNGRVTLGSTTNLSFSAGDGTSDSTMTFRGSVTAINTALNGLRYLGNTNYSGAETLTITTTDLGNTGDGGPLTDVATVSINVLGVNDAPTISGPAANVLVNAETFAFTGGNTISIADTDAATGLVTVTLSVNDPGGLLEVSTTTGLSAVSGNGSANQVTFTGTVADVNAALATLTYEAADINGAALLTVLVSDNGNTGVDPSVISLPHTGTATNEQATRTFNLTVSDINDAPVNNVPGAQTVNEDANRFFTGVNTISISDADAFNGSVTTTLSVANGTLTATGTGVSGSGTNTLTINGTVTQVNAALQTLRYRGLLNFNGSDTLTIRTNDNGNTGIGGPLIDEDTIAITVNPVNDAPVNTVPSARAVLEDGAIVFSNANGNAIRVADVDVNEGTGILTVTLGVTKGTLRLSGVSGLTFTTGDGTDDSSMTFSGTVTDINAALQGLTYNPTPDYNGSAQLSILTSDNGNFGSGGTRTDSDTVNITVGAVPDVVNDVLATDEDTPITFNVITGTNDAEADSFSNPGRAVTSHTNPAHGTLTVLPNGEITYSPDLNWHGVDTFQYTVTSGGVTETATVTITVNSVNDRPVAIDDSFSVPEDGSVTIDVLDDDYDVDGDTLTITEVDGQAISEGGSVSVTNGSVKLVGGKLIFTPTPDYFGPASFNYTISDSQLSSTANVSGTVVQTPRALTIADVTVDESQNLVFTVVLNKSTASAFTVEVSTIAVSATGGGTDYTSLSGTVLSFAGTKGETVTFTVQVNNDSLIENNEALQVVLGNISIADVNITDTAIGTITDNDARLLPTGPGTGVTTDVELVANGSGGFDLVIEDVETNSPIGFSSDVPVADSTDNLLIYRDGADYVIRDTGGLWLGSPIIGAMRGATNEIRVPASMVTGSIIVRSGIGNDVITVRDLGANLTGDLIIDTEDPADRYLDSDTINYDSNSTLASGADARFRAETINGLADSELEATGDGTILWDAGRNIVMGKNARLTSDSGDVTLQANLDAAVSGRFQAIVLDNADVASATGDARLEGRGGDTDDRNFGVNLMSGSSIITAGTIDIVGTGGGDGTSAAQLGVLITGSELTSSDSAGLSVSGTGGDGIQYAAGVTIEKGSTLDAGTGDLTIRGTGGVGGSNNYGVSAAASAFESDGGTILIEGTGAGTNAGIGARLIGGSITNSGDGSITIRGTGSAGLDSNSGVHLQGEVEVTGEDGNILIEGTTAGTGAKNFGVNMTGNSSINTNGGDGDITVRGTGGTGITGIGVVLNIGNLTVGDGDLAVQGTGRGSSYGRGVELTKSNLQSLGTGEIDIDGTGSATGTGNYGAGVYANGSSISARGTGAIDIDGTGATGLSINHGVQLSATRVEGALVITISGQARGTNGSAAGVALERGTVVAGTAGANVNITGTGSTSGSAAARYQRGVLISASTASVANGQLTLAGTGGGAGNGTLNHGVDLASGVIRATGSGNVVVTGQGSRNGTGINGAKSTISSASGNVVLTGNGGTGPKNTRGISLVRGNLNSTGGGDITVRGTAHPNTSGTGNIGVNLEQLALGTGGRFQISGTGGGGSAKNHGVVMNKVNRTGAAPTVNGVKTDGSAKSSRTSGNYFD